MTHRTAILDTAASLITGEKQAEYGPPAEAFATYAALWTTYLGARLATPIEPHEVAVMMALLKIGRSMHSPEKPDTWRDTAGYVAIAGELAPVKSTLGPKI